MRFLHTADWQIGMPAVHVGSAAERVRAIRLKTARHVFDLARREQVEFIVLAGDTLEHNAPEVSYVCEIEQIFADAHCPVLILPGNHDRLEPGSVWLDSRWDGISNVTVLREPAPLEIRGVQILPCPVRSRKSELNPTAWIDPAHTDSFRLVIAHGAVPNGLIGIDDHPIP